MCEYCNPDSPRDYPFIPCANGDLGVRATFLRGAIINFYNCYAASYTDINYCPFCGRLITDEERHYDNSDLIAVLKKEDDDD